MHGWKGNLATPSGLGKIVPHLSLSWFHPFFTSKIRRLFELLLRRLPAVRAPQSCQGTQIDINST